MNTSSHIWIDCECANESWPIRISHVTYDRVIWRQDVDEWMSHVTYDGVMSHLNASCHMWMISSDMNESRQKWMSHVTHGCVMLHMSESRHMQDPYLTWKSHVPYKWVMTISSGTNAPESHVRHAWDMSHVDKFMSHMIESFHIWIRFVTFECVVSQLSTLCHIWIRVSAFKGSISHISESCQM